MFNIRILHFAHGVYVCQYRVYLPGVREPGRAIDHPNLSGAEVKERVELYLYSTFGPSRPLL